MPTDGHESASQTPPGGSVATVASGESAESPAAAFVPPRQFLKALSRSNLVGETDLRRALAAVKVKNAGTIPDESSLLAQLLIASGLITDWQASHLLLGRSKGFFLGKYKLIRHLGSGGMATVYLAEHNVMNKRHAIKVLPKERLLEKPGSLARFQGEARTAAMLDHENIVRTLDIDEVDGRHFIVMEFIDGSDLERVTRKQGKLSIGRAVGYLRQAAAGLQHAHERGVLHRDIKPLNLLITRDGVLKVSDLGLARLRHDIDYESTDKSPSVVGTADYMAPEQARNSNTIDGRADLYALGCTLYFMLTGSAPYTGGTLQERLAQHQMDPAPDLAAARADTPDDLVAIYERLMEKQPDDRYATATDLLAAIDRFIAEHGSTIKASAGGSIDSQIGGSRKSGPSSRSGIRNASPSVEASLFDDPVSSGSGSLSDDAWDDLGAADLGDLGDPTPMSTLAPAASLNPQPQKTPPDTNEIVRKVGIAALAVAAGIVVVVMVNVMRSKDPALETDRMIKFSEDSKNAPIVILRD